MVYKFFSNTNHSVILGRNFLLIFYSDRKKYLKSDNIWKYAWKRHLFWESRGLLYLGRSLKFKMDRIADLPAVRTWGRMRKDPHSIRFGVCLVKMCSETSFLPAREITLSFLSTSQESINNRRSKLVSGHPHPKTRKQQEHSILLSTPGDWNWESRQVAPVTATYKVQPLVLAHRPSLCFCWHKPPETQAVWAVGVCYCHSKGIDTLVHALRRQLAEPGWQPLWNSSAHFLLFTSTCFPPSSPLEKPPQ